MEKMSQSRVMTSGQIGKIQEMLGAGLRKADLPSEPTQQVLENQGSSLVSELVTVVRKYVETAGNTIIRRAKVNRDLLPREVIDAMGRRQYTNCEVVEAMPRGDGEEAEIIFFKLGCYVSDDDLEKEYSLRGLVAADPYSLAAVNLYDPAFADEHPNSTHWKDAGGKWCYAAFSRWYGGRRVRVRRVGGDWYDYWWFAGLRK